MTWYFKLIGQHVHVRVYCNGALAGHLVFRDYEFENIKENNQGLIAFKQDPI